MEAIVNTEELDIFETTALIDMADYKWGAFALKAHSFGSFIHFCYIVTICLYVN